MEKSGLSSFLTLLFRTNLQSKLLNLIRKTNPSKQATMKFSITAVAMVIAFPAVQAGTLPDGFRQQCCVPESVGTEPPFPLPGVPGEAKRHLEGLLGLKGYDPVNGISPFCSAEGGLEFEGENYNCYDHTTICSDFIEGQSLGLCNDEVFCYDADSQNANCVDSFDDPEAYEDIFWLCQRIGGIYCGFTCKITGCTAEGDPHFQAWVSEERHRA